MMPFKAITSFTVCFFEVIIAIKTFIKVICNSAYFNHFASSISFITIFDNGNRNSTSRVVGYCIDPETKELKAFRSYTLGGKYSEACGSAQHLYDEVYVIGWGAAMGNPEAMTVVDFAIGETLLSVSLKNPMNNTYRCLYFE
jgi:hypothetical protein